MFSNEIRGKNTPRRPYYKLHYTIVVKTRGNGEPRAESALSHFCAHTAHSSAMDGNGGEKRKADEMADDSVQVPLEELRSVAEKAGKHEKLPAQTAAGGAHVFSRVSAFCRVRGPYWVRALGSVCCARSTVVSMLWLFGYVDCCISCNAS